MTKGFTLVELLVSLTITLLIAAAVAQAVPSARAAFDRIPAHLELQQRGRIALDTMTQALRAAERVSVENPDEEGRYSELTVITPVANAAQGVLSIDQPKPAAALTLDVSPCPGVKDLCGFSAGVVAMISDGDGHFDVFIVTAVNAAQRKITPAAALSRAYAAGSRVIEVSQQTFGLARQADGSHSLVRVTAAGAVQPIADFVSSLAFTIAARQVGIELTADAQVSMGRRGLAARVFRTSITARNAS